MQLIAARVGVSRGRWSGASSGFAEESVEGLLRDKMRKPGKPPIAAETVARVIALTCADPAQETTH